MKCVTFKGNTFLFNSPQYAYLFAHRFLVLTQTTHAFSFFNSPPLLQRAIPFPSFPTAISFLFPSHFQPPLLPIPLSFFPYFPPFFPSFPPFFSSFLPFLPFLPSFLLSFLFLPLFQPPLLPIPLFFFPSFPPFFLSFPPFFPSCDFEFPYSRV